jgi:cytochrome c oxidase assembly protein subunit 15
VARFARFSWIVLAYSVAVILFGAVVRITGSGAGCGQHWPTCQGEVLHLPKSTATAIELTHRVTSGLSVVFVVALAVAAFRRFPKGHASRRAAVASVVFIFTESLVGAALVLLELVGKNTSVARAAVMGVHLVNTSFLTAALALTAWTATRPAPKSWMPSCGLDWALIGGLVGAVVVSITGAVTALGDTLYPVETTKGFAERLAADQGASASFFERGRAVHPLVAILVAATLLLVIQRTRAIRPHPPVESAARLASVLVFAQVGAGVVNIWLSAPAAMQVLHLGIATALWLSLVLLYATAMAERRA